MLRKFRRIFKRLCIKKLRRLPDASRPLSALERRRSPRVPSRNLIRILRRDRLSMDHLFNLADFSEGGFCIRTDLDAEPGSIVEAVVNFRERYCQLPVKLRVVWVHKSRRGLVWAGKMGVENTDLPGEARFILKQLVFEKLIRLRAA